MRRGRAYRRAQEERIKAKKRRFANGESRGYPQPYYEQIEIKETSTGQEKVIWYKECNLGHNYTDLKRRYAHKAVRQYKGYIKSGNHYRKVYGLWWNAF